MPFFPDPNQQQQPFDWGSLASALIPAAAGLAFGGRRRGLLAAYGAAEGLAEQGRAKAEAEKEQRDWELKQERERREQEVANANIQHRQLQMQDLQTKSAQALKDQKSWEDFVKSLPSDVQKEASAYPMAHRQDFMKAWIDGKMDKHDREAISKQLQAAGFPKEKADAMTAEGIPIKSVLQYPSEIVRSQLTNKEWHVFDPQSGQAHVYDPRTGQTKTIQMQAPRPTTTKEDTEADKIMSQARQEITAATRNTPLADTPEESLKIFQKMVDDRARIIATARGKPGLFAPLPKPKALPKVGKPTATDILKSLGVPEGGS